MRDWLAREKLLVGSIVLLVGFWRLSLPPYDSELVSQRLESFLPSVVLQFQVQARVCFVVVDFS